MAERSLARLLRGPARAGALSASPSLDSAFRELFDASPGGLAFLDAEDRVLLANGGLVRMAGAAGPVRPGLPLERLLDVAARPALRAHLGAARLGASATEPLLARPADPSAPAYAEWALHARPFVLRDVPAALLVIVADLTEQRRAAARLAAAERLETVGRLAGGIAHDFNNLLSAILGAAATAREAALPHAAILEIAQIEEAARRGAGLVRQVLAFARQQRLEPRVVDLRRALEDATPLLRRLMGRGIEIELVLEAGSVPVRVDPAQLDQVLLNLAANAKEAMPAGGRLRIALSRAVVLRPEGEGADAVPPGRYAVLEVSDTGAGIPPEILPRLFEPFFTTRPDRGGTGLGLATVQGIVAQSSGHIAVVSSPGQGTCFRIHLPRTEGVVEPAPAAVVPARLAEEDSGMILLVDDEVALRRLSARILEGAGHRVETADCAETALELLADAALPPRALVSDVAMPGIDGVALARRLRARWPGLPVLLLSGYAESLLGEDLAGAGMAFLAKPFAPAELVAALASLVGGVPGGPEAPSAASGR